MSDVAYAVRLMKLKKKNQASMKEEENANQAHFRGIRLYFFTENTWIYNKRNISGNTNREKTKKKVEHNKTYFQIMSPPPTANANIAHKSGDEHNS